MKEIIFTVDLKQCSSNIDKRGQTKTKTINLITDPKGLATRGVTSILRKKEAAVPLWVIIIATLVGILIMLLIAFALHERRSAIERESKRFTKKLDERELIEESDGSEPSSPKTAGCKPLSTTEGETATKSPEKDMPSAGICEELPTNMTKSYDKNMSSEEKSPRDMIDDKKIK
ncbi:unnamed protein product [Diatraea saccharalis]|uniref:Uncharacterized protein n=1 Tax=Diatraea saccharalis TaxID=40085 RepID=A0A9N9QV78_9NEOP|nr:unnamed protein product [Diatraea saccharalis]